MHGNRFKNITSPHHHTQKCDKQHENINNKEKEKFEIHIDIPNSTEHTIAKLLVTSSISYVCLIFLFSLDGILMCLYFIIITCTMSLYQYDFYEHLYVFPQSWGFK